MARRSCALAALAAVACASAPDWPARAAAVRGALHDSFVAWEALARGADDLAPVSETGLDWLHARATLFDALDSLYVAGLMSDFDRAVARVFSPGFFGGGGGAPTSALRPVKVFEYHIRIVGGLLGAFEVSGDRRLLHAAA